MILEQSVNDLSFLNFFPTSDFAENKSFLSAIRIESSCLNSVFAMILLYIYLFGEQIGVAVWNDGLQNKSNL